MKTQLTIGSFAACALLLVLPSLSANLLHMADNSVVAFRTIRWDASNNVYLVQSVSGGDALLTVAKKNVAWLENDKPAELAQAEQLANAGKNNEAAALLLNVIASFSGLNWDQTAREALARVYVKGNEPAKAIQMVDELIAAGSPISVSLRQEYWKALLAVDPKSAKVMKDLGEAIATGPREIVPVAQNLRGDLLRAAGRKEDALADYLRIVLFFENAAVLRAEALAKASELYDELGDAARANELRQKLNKK